MMILSESCPSRDETAAAAVGTAGPLRNMRHVEPSTTPTSNVDSSSRKSSRRRRKEPVSLDPPSKQHHVAVDVKCMNLQKIAQENDDYLVLSNRWLMWASTFLSSFVAAFSIATAVPPSHRNGIDSAALALVCISLLVSGAATCSFFINAQHHMIERIETLITAFMVCVWSTVLYLTTNANNNLAVSGSQVWNWNLFCSSWASYGQVVYLFCYLMVSAPDLLFEILC